MTAEGNLLIAKNRDLYRLCDKYQKPQFSTFLNEAEQVVIKDNVGTAMGYETCFYGGYRDAMRTVFGVFPEWQGVEKGSFPIKVIRIIKKYKRN